MTTIDPLLKQEKWRIIDQSSLGTSFHALQSFAIDDTLCQFVGDHTSSPVIRSWVHHNTIVLGITDSRLPFIEKGTLYLQDQGYNVIVRNSGGLAVVLDKGILNLSIILPETNRIEINRGYDAMWSLVREMLSKYPVNIDAREIIGSYCPGSYDLSIGGKKFAGISQRRVRGGIAVQVYLCVNGSGAKRASIIKEFYDLSLGKEETKFTYPRIMPETMASLSELLQVELDVNQLMLSLFQTLRKHNDSLTSSSLTLAEYDLFQHNYDRILKRNEKVLLS